MEHHENHGYLIDKVQPFDVNRIKDCNDLLKNLRYCGFQGKNLGLALDILEKMTRDEECLTVLTLSGAMVPAGMGEIICTLLEHKLIDVLVTTGANIIHDLVDLFSNVGHYRGNRNVDDEELFHHRINRIYDIFLPEDNYLRAEEGILRVIHTIFEEKQITITPSELFKKLGASIKERCILSIAAQNDIPIFNPAFSDSEFALNLIKYSVREGYHFQLDMLQDVQKFAKIIQESKRYGTFIIGGGVPRNWAQQVFPLLDQLEKIQTMGYNYSVRIHTAVEHDGGLSGCTISESKSWGKYSLDSTHVSVWCDATIALPLLVVGLFQRLGFI